MYVRNSTGLYVAFAARLEADHVSVETLAR
jgi:hypothetical protein